MAHLQDLFTTGEEVTVVDTFGTEYVIWVVRPTSLQQEESRERANGKLARFKMDAWDEESDRSVALRLTFAEMEDFDDLVDMRLQYDEPQVQETAFNDVVYEKDSKWAEDDRYLNLMSAISERMVDIQTYNTQMEESGSDERISFETDDQLVPLMAEQDTFREDVEVRAKSIVDEQRAEHVLKSEEDLRKELISMAIDLEAKMTWYEAYQMRMLFYACRYNDDRKKFYFADADDVGEVPSYIKTQLFSAYERVEQGSGDLKNLLSLPNSLA